MKVVLIDGQGGGIGKRMVQALKQALPEQQILALGTNAAATAAMLRAGADMGATGENAICYQCRSADILVGVMGILQANAMLGEISPAIAAAVSASPAQKVLIPMERCGVYVAGVQKQPLEGLIRETVREVVFLCAAQTRPLDKKEEGEH